LNPSDQCSRGANIQDLIGNDFWLKGPRFLYDDKEEWPEKKDLALPKEEIKKDEYKPIFNFYVRALDIPIIEDFNSLEELKVAMAQALRTRNGQNQNDPITAQELEDAFLELVKIAQEEGYPEDLQELRANQVVQTKSPIFKLCPTLDEKEIMRLKTRLENSDSVPYDTRFPILLPRDHHITKLIILEIHDKIHHSYGNNMYCLS